MGFVMNMYRNLNLGCVLDESGTDEEECNRMVASGSRVAGGIRSLINARSLKLECAQVLHKALLVPVLTYGSETLYGRRRRGLSGFRVGPPYNGF